VRLCWLERVRFVRFWERRCPILGADLEAAPLWAEPEWLDRARMRFSSRTSAVADELSVAVPGTLVLHSRTELGYLLTAIRLGLPRSRCPPCCPGYETL
jgi:hypothetical protein